MRLHTLGLNRSFLTVAESPSWPGIQCESRVLRSIAIMMMGLRLNSDK